MNGGLNSIKGSMLSKISWAFCPFKGGNISKVNSHPLVLASISVIFISIIQIWSKPFFGQFHCYPTRGSVGLDLIFSQFAYRKIFAIWMSEVIPTHTRSRVHRETFRQRHP